MANQFWYSRQGVRGGPVDGDKLRQIVASGGLAGDDLVVKAGTENWVRVDSVPAFQQYAANFAPPMSAPREHIETPPVSAETETGFEYARREYLNRPSASNSKRKYVNLQRVVGWLKFYAYFALIVSAIFAAVIFVTIFDVGGSTGADSPREPTYQESAQRGPRVAMGIIAAAGTVLVGIFQFVILMAIAEFLTLAMDVEEHTRQTKGLIERLRLNSS